MSIANRIATNDTQLISDRVEDNPLTQLFTYRIGRLHLAMEAQATAVLKKVSDMTLGQWRIMVILGELGTLSSKEIVRLTSLDGALISRTVRSLELAKLISVSRPEYDRRLLTVSLSAKGRAQYNRILPTMRARQSAYKDSIDAHEQEQLLLIIEKLEKAASIKSF